MLGLAGVAGDEVLTAMKQLFVISLSTICLLAGCATTGVGGLEEAQLYSHINPKMLLLVPIAYDYGIITKIDDRKVEYNENPVLLSPGRHRVEVKYGRCFSPVLILCELHSSKSRVTEKEFTGGKKYSVNIDDGYISEI